MRDHQRFAPVLLYLVEKDGMYIRPGREGFVSGQTAWADPDVQVDEADVYAFARSVPGAQVVKLRVYAERETVRKNNRADLSHVPSDGREAFHQGWSTKSCPHDPNTTAAMLWISDWWRANAEAFADHIGEPL